MAEVLDTPSDEMPSGPISQDPTRPTAPHRSGPERWIQRILPPMLYLSASLFLYSHFLARPTSGVPGGPDGVIYVWYFEWERQAVLHLHNPFFSPAMHAPFGVNVMWNTSLWLLAVICVPLTATIGPFATVGLMMMLSPVVSASLPFCVGRSTITPKSGCGGIWTPVSSRPFFTPARPGCPAPKHGVHKVKLPWAEPLPRFTLADGAIDHRCDSASADDQRRLRRSCASAGTKPWR